MAPRSQHVMLLAEDEGLGVDLDSDQLAAATMQTRAAVINIARGIWRQRQWPEEAQHGLGLFVLDGILLRYITLEGRRSAELLGRGDLLRPWDREDPVSLSSRRVSWRALSDCRLAILDHDFFYRIAAYPDIQLRLTARVFARARRLGIQTAIVQHPSVEKRLQLILSHLARQWGSESSGGVMLGLPLTQIILAELVAARRQTVSTHLAAMERQGQIAHNDQGWLLPVPRAP